MGHLYDRFDIEPIKGKDITIGEHFPEIFVSQSDEVFCYVGVCLNDNEHHRRAVFMHPHYMVGKHSTNDKISKEILGFYRVAKGCIFLDNYLDAGIHSNSQYKKIECGIQFPTTDSYYSVIVNCEDDVELTRGVFGLSHDEITSFLDAYAKTMGTYNDYASYPKLTRSTRTSNFCDMTDIWIPERFPYVAFRESGYDFSHVSLWSFYRHIQMLTGYDIDAAFSRVIIKSGANVEVLKEILNMNICYPYLTKVTSRIVNE